LKLMCSKKCASPFFPSVRLPLSIYTPTVTVCVGSFWVAIRKPDFRVVRRVRDYIGVRSVFVEERI